MTEHALLRSQSDITGPWSLPRGWEWRQMGSRDGACLVNPRRPKLTCNDDSLTSFLPMEGVDEVYGAISALQSKPFQEVRRGYTYFEENDVLFAKITPSMQNGKSAIARGLIDKFGFGSTEFHVLRPHPNILPEWIYLYVRQLSFRLEASKHFKSSVGQQRVPEDFIREYPIPIPYPDEPTISLRVQRVIVARIEALLGELREMRELHATIDRDVGEVMESVLADVFPDVDNPLRSEWRKVDIGSLGTIKGGGTPSKANPHYWNGSIPWISPKDMKSCRIDQTIDHITGEALRKSSQVSLLPEKSILMVFRSGILAHSFPMALNCIPATINQDLKAIIPYDEFLPEYVIFALRARQHAILQKHVKKGPTVHSINSESFWRDYIVVPSSGLQTQRQIVAYLNAMCDEVNEMQAIQAKDRVLLAEVEQSLLAQAFRGEL